MERKSTRIYEKPYVAILSGLSPIAKRRFAFTPELREMRNQTMLFVFGL